tara:strand:+ start:2256 stop:2669 length:414 start_codon:yes stop_codon:yes gene_type:complete
LNDNLTDKDRRDWKTFLESNDRVPNKDIKNKEKKTFKTQSIDLHGFTLEKANIIVESFINTNFKEGTNKLVIVTGKGLHSKNEADPFVSKDLSILKYSVPEFIKNNAELMKKISDIREADVKDGGSGAFYIYLKKLK